MAIFSRRDPDPAWTHVTTYPKRLTQSVAHGAEKRNGPFQFQESAICVGEYGMAKMIGDSGR